MKSTINLRNSISADNLNDDIYNFEDKSAPLVSNNGIHKLGGITNIREVNYDLQPGSHYVADNGDFIRVDGSKIYINDELIFSEHVDSPIEKIASINTSVSRDILMLTDYYYTIQYDGARINVYKYDYSGNIDTGFSYSFALSGVFMIGFVRGIETEADIEVYNYDGAFIKAYNSSGTLKLTITAVGSTTFNYVYCYRYASGKYLAGLINNTVNEFYTKDGAGAQVAIKGRYVIEQKDIISGYARHVVTETPRFDGTRLYAVSLVGYTSFTATWSGVNNYPADTTVVSSILQSQIGYGYADFTFKKTSSATNIFNFIFPAPNDVNLPVIIQSNSNTLIGSYGKLTNTYSKLATKEIRIHWSRGLATGRQVSIGLASTPIAFDVMGTVLSDIGGFDETYAPYHYNGKLLYRTNNGGFEIVQYENVGSQNTPRIQRISDNLYKINTISPLNILDVSTKTLSLGSSDYNGRFSLQSVATPSTSSNKKIVAQLRAPYSSGADYGDVLTQIPTPTSANIDIISYKVPNLTTYNLDLIDVYIEDVYSFTQDEYGTEKVLSDPDNPLYIPDTRLPVPMMSNYTSGVAQNSGTTFFLNPTFDGYEIGNDKRGDYRAFSLFGQTYLFDSFSIYIANIQTNILVGLDFICSAVGMLFVAQSPTEAYFISDFDNSLYIFNGGRSLSKAKEMTLLEPVLSGVYSVKESTLLLNTRNTFIWIRDGLITQQTKLSAQVGNVSLFSTTDGIVISNLTTRHYKYPYYPQVLFGFSSQIVKPLSFQTAYYGQTANQKSNVLEYVITLYSETRLPMTVIITEKSKDQDAQYENTVRQELYRDDWDSIGYAHIRLIPVYQKSLGSSLQIDIAEKVVVLDVSIVWDDNTTATIASNKTQ